MATFNVPSGVARATRKHLRAQGAKRREGVVLWRGTLVPPRVTAAIIPYQEASYGRFQVPLVERQRLTRELAGTGEFIVAQVHSHPKRAFHSDVDDDEAIPRRVGSYSLVVPDFGARINLLEDAALYRLEAGGSWEPAPLDTFELSVKGGLWQWLIARAKSFVRFSI